MPRKQSTNRNVGNVQKFVGTSYDEMKALYDNLDALLALETGVQYTLRYLGPSAGDAPSTREDGSPIQDGDYFFDTDADALVYYDAVDDIWFAVDPSEVIQARDEAIAASIVAGQAKDNAELAANNARLSENTAKVYETNAEASKDAAGLSEMSAGLSATDAATYAAQSAIDASNTAADVMTTNADVVTTTDNAATTSTHAINAKNSETAAALSAQQAEQAFDSFDDRYLGTFSTPPTTDNDGDPLVKGATYYNSVELAVYYWNGAVWEAPDKSASDSADAAAASAATATTKAGEASNAATTALNAQTAAKSSENAAQSSQNAAEAAEVGAELAESNAATSEANAAESETVARASENNAANSAASAKENADRSEQHAAGGKGLTLAIRDALRAQRKREYTGSGFTEWGNQYDYNDGDPVQHGLWTYYGSTGSANELGLGADPSVDPNNLQGESRTDYPIANVDGVEMSLIGSTTSTPAYKNANKILFPTAPDGSKTLNESTGEVRKYHDLAGVGTPYEAHTVDFDGSTYIDLVASPYVMPVGSKVEFKFKLNDVSGYQYLFDTQNLTRVYIYKTTGTNNLLWGGFGSTIKVNGVDISTNTFAVEAGVEYHIEATTNATSNIDRIGAKSAGGVLSDFARGQIWDITLASSEDGVEPITYNTVTTQPKDDAAPVVSEIDAGDNPDMPTGYMPFYQDAGYVTIPEFPLADSMNISMVMRPDNDTELMVFGQNPEGQTMRLYWYNDTSSGLFRIAAGSGTSLTFDPLVAGRVYVTEVQIRKNVGASDYTVTAQVNGVIKTQSNVTFGHNTFDSFTLGSEEGVKNNNRWDGAIFGFGIEYPDAPDLNRTYGSVEVDDPAGRLTVEDDLGFGTEDWTPEFDGFNNVIVPPVMNFTGIARELEMTVVPDNVGSSWRIGQTFSKDGEVNRFYLRYDASGTITAGIGNATIQSVLNMTVGETYNFKFICDNSLNIELFVNGVSTITGTTSFRADFVLDNFYLGAAGTADSGPSEHLNGKLTNVRITDPNSVANSRHYPLVINQPTQPDTLIAEDAGYDKDTAPFYTPSYSNTDGWVEIPEITLGSGDAIKLKFQWEDEGKAYDGILDNASVPSLHLRIHNDGRLRWTNHGTLRVNGTVYTDGSFYPVSGEVYEVEIALDRNLTLARIGRLYNGNPWSGKIWDIEFTDNTDPTNSRYYPSVDYRVDGDTSGTVLDETHGLLSDSFSDGRWVESAAGTINGESLTITSSFGSGRVGTFPSPAINGVDVTVSFDVVSYSGTTNGGRVIVYRNGSQDGNLGTFDSSDVGTRVTLTANPTGNYGSDGNDVVFYVDASGISFEVANVEVSANNNGTLVNFPSGSEWTLAQVDGASDGTLENFTAGLEWNNDLPITDGTMVGFAQPWHHETGRYIGSIIGETTQAVWDVQDSQKAFHDVKYNADFHVITSRKDLVFLETWLEKVEGFVRPYGNVQFGGSSHDGVTLVPVTNFKAQGYSAFGEWDENTVGKVADWDAMTPTQKSVWASNPKNNLVFNPEDNEYYQDSYRIRTVEGLGDDWQRAGMKLNHTYDRMAYRTNDLAVVPKLHNESIAADLGSINRGNFTPKTTDDSVNDYGFFQALNTSQGFVEGGAALPIALTQRLNQGAYHPTYNPSGCRQWNQDKDNGGAGTWTHPDVSHELITSTEQAFDIQYGGLGRVGAHSLTGYIGAGTGRSDQYDYYDAIYAGQVEDLRLNANKQDKQELLTDAVRRGVRGETRGKGKVPFTSSLSTGADKFTTPTGRIYRTSSTGSSFFIDYNSESVLEFRDKFSVGDTIRFNDRENDVYLVGTISGFDTSGSSLNVRITGTYNGYTVVPSYVGTISDFTLLGVLVEQELSAEYDSLPWVDLIGDPQRISATFPDGVVGQWLSTIPDNGSHFFYFNEKANGDVQRQFTVDDGVNWTSGGVTEDFVQNGFTWAPNALTVALLHYEALSDFTESDDNRAVLGKLGDVVTSDFNAINFGNRLMPSLIGEIAKNSVGSSIVSRNLSVTSNAIDPNTGVARSGSRYPQHAPVIGGAPTNDSDAVKALPHLVEKDGLLYVQWHGTQLVYSANGTTGNEWGDTFAGTTFTSPYGEITIVDGESTKIDENGNTVKVVTHTEQIPIGIANHNQDN
ncbi:hypothetical protein VPHK482G1_0003 [Vibrio phage K482 g1]